MNRRTLLKALAFVPIAPVAAWAVKKQEAMAADAFASYDANGNREELSDKIWAITPEETPFISQLKRKRDWPEWQTDE